MSAARIAAREANMAKLLAAEAIAGQPPTSVCKPMAVSALPPNTMSSANSARRGSIRWRRLSTNLILAYVGEHVLHAADRT